MSHPRPPLALESRAKDFGPFHDHVWLNAANQGPLPRVAVEAMQEAIRDKIEPWHFSADDFHSIIGRLKTSISKLIGSSPEEVILGNSTSYGLNLLVQGLPLREGDEVLLVQGDFPASVITWLPLRNKGIDVRLLTPQAWPPSPEEIAEALSERTKVFCSSWVFSFFGHTLDIEGVGRVCQEQGVTFVLNGTQALGARAIDVHAVPVDVLVSCGFKWQCGPYGTGFTWMRDEILDSLGYEQAYWVAHVDPLSPSYELKDDIGAAAYDVFGTANPVNFLGWRAALEYLLDIGSDEVAQHDAALVDAAVAGLKDSGYELVSPLSGPRRSTLVLFTHPDPNRNAKIAEVLRNEKIHIAERDGKLRISPHIYNSIGDVEAATDLLAELS